jgi:hypothetical protein
LKKAKNIFVILTNVKDVVWQTLDQTLLLQTSREDINVNVPKMIKWKDIKLPEKGISQTRCHPQYQNQYTYIYKYLFIYFLANVMLRLLAWCNS